jgi:hypothetical protein
MAVVTKIKIKAGGTMEAGKFIEGSAKTLFKPNSDVLTGEIREVADSNVKITKDNQIIATEFIEK